MEGRGREGEGKAQEGKGEKGGGEEEGWRMRWHEYFLQRRWDCPCHESAIDG